jgi:all-trans-8'-apo-beta-carotenal 15,15'-oxygenase
MTNVSRRDFGALMLGAAFAAAAPAWAQSPPNWRIGFQTPPTELDSELTLISGRLPHELEGVLFRVGPGQFERGGERLGHWFDGDGMVQRFAISDGRVRHRGRFVATDKRSAEAAAGRFLYSGYGFAPEDLVPFTRADELNAANTNVLPMGGELWTLWEGGSPWRVQSENLHTLGRQVFAGPLDGAPFSAHPKRDPNGEIWNFGVFGSRCVIWRLAPDGTFISATPIALPAASMMHDFAITRRHIVLLAPPMLMHNGPARSLVDRYVWRSEEPLRAIVLDKDDLTRQRVFELPAKFLFHIGNAWEDNDGSIRVDAFLHNDARFATTHARDLLRGVDAGEPDAHPALITLYADGRAEMQVLDGRGEFPRVDPRRVGERNRYTYSVINSGLARWDWQSGDGDRFVYGPDYWSEEPIFVPRQGQGREADGWVVATALNTRSEKTELAVFDARRLSDGPAALLTCPYALPLGFHGAFAM